jgi:hypothetical protein
MGKQLEDIYKEAEEKGGFVAVTKLVLVSGFKSSEVSSAPDDDAVIARCKEVLSKL